jgi:spoIIIJ-associated protein
MSQRASARGDDLQSALRSALRDLFDQDVDATLGLPDDVKVSRVRVTLEADIASVTEAATDGDGDRPASTGEVAPRQAQEPDDAPRESSDEEASLDDEADAAADFLEGLLDAMDLPGHLKIRILDEDDQAEVEVIDVGGGVLIGRRGQTLEAIQELLRSAMQREFQQRSRVKVDVEGYRARRMEKLVEKTEEAIDAALDTGEPQRLEPMDVFERKAVHRLVGERGGLVSRSQGREPGRRVVIEVE